MANNTILNSHRRSYQQPSSIPIPLILPPFTALNANTSTNTAISSTHPSFGTTTFLPHPYHLSNPLRLHQRLRIPIPWLLLKTITRRFLTTLGLMLSLLMTWWTYASLQAAWKANKLAEIANLLAFRAECRDVMQSAKSGDSSQTVGEGCKEALEADLHIEITEKWETDEHIEGIRKQGDATIMFGIADEDGLWLSEEEVRSVVVRDRAIKLRLSTDAGIMYGALPSCDPHVLWQAEQAVRILRSTGIDVDGQIDWELNTSDQLDLHRFWSPPGLNHWLAYAPGYRRRWSSELDYLPDCGRGLLRWQGFLDTQSVLGYQLRPGFNTIDDSWWKMSLEDDRFIMNTNESCLLVRQGEVSLWNDLDCWSMSESWMNDYRESESDAGRGQSFLSTVVTGGGLEAMVCCILWSFWIWFMFRAAWQPSKHKPGWSGREKYRKTEKVCE